MPVGGGQQVYEVLARMVKSYNRPPIRKEAVESKLGITAGLKAELERDVAETERAARRERKY